MAKKTTVDFSKFSMATKLLLLPAFVKAFGAVKAYLLLYGGK